MFESTMYITRKEKLIKKINLISILIWVLLLEQEKEYCLEFDLLVNYHNLIILFNLK
jgi:hypothetical protein